MIKKLLHIGIIGTALSASVLAIGCTSGGSEKPYSVTGQQTSPQYDSRAFDRSGNYHADWAGKPWLNPRYNDDKGHYHPDWVGEAGR
jgi:hypothetical protein